jgi:hypothetical protein
MGSSLVREQKKKALLKGFAELGVLQPVLDRLKIDRTTYKNWRDRDPEFAAAFEQAKVAAVESLEKEMIRRGRDGWMEPVYHKGEEVGEIRKFSDTLLIFALKGWAPEKYRERIDVKGEHQHIHLHAHRLIGPGEATTLESESIARVLGALAGPAGGTRVADQGTDGGASAPQP